MKVLLFVAMAILSVSAVLFAHGMDIGRPTWSFPAVLVCVNALGIIEGLVFGLKDGKGR